MIHKPQPGQLAGHKLVIHVGLLCSWLYCVH